MLFIYWLISNLVAMGVAYWKSDNYHLWRKLMFDLTGYDTFSQYFEVYQTCTRVSCVCYYFIINLFTHTYACMCGYIYLHVYIWLVGEI